MRISAEFLWEFEVSWFSWGFASSKLNFSELRSIEIKVTKKRIESETDVTE